MSSENLETVRRLFEAVQERDLPAVLEAYDSEVVIHEAESLPYGGTYEGSEDAKRHSINYATAWAPLQSADHMDMEATFLCSRDRVVALWRQKGVSRSGTELDMPAVSVYKMRNGRIVESRMFHADTAAVVDFLEDRTR